MISFVIYYSDTPYFLLGLDEDSLSKYAKPLLTAYDYERLEVAQEIFFRLNVYIKVVYSILYLVLDALKQ